MEETRGGGLVHAYVGHRTPPLPEVFYCEVHGSDVDRWTHALASTAASAPCKECGGGVIDSRLSRGGLGRRLVRGLVWRDPVPGGPGEVPHSSGSIMQFEQRDVGDYRLYAGVREVAPDNFEAMVVVEHAQCGGARQEIFRSQRFTGSRLFATADAALSAAFRQGDIAIRGHVC